MLKSATPSLSVVIPVYRAAESLPELHRRLVAVLEDLPGGFEMVFVEDCGGDYSWEVIKTLAAADWHVQGFHMSRQLRPA